MEVALSGPQTLSEPLRRRASLPLSQLVEATQSRGNIPNHLLESKIYANLKSNSLIQAEPSELHFSGFELGKDYVKILKLINISSEVMNIHVIPTQTKYFQTTYTKKYRLIPGLAYTLKVGFCPDEWRYFYDCIRVHCKGEDNLLIPVHAYPVIDDLHIPTHIDLPAVALRQSVCHAIPLRCSCPIGFEFQVHIIQPHESFSIHPLTGVIPAKGEAKITVTFCPLQFETSQITFQLVISQFNTKPYLCTITGSCAPHIALSELEKKFSYESAVTVKHKGASPSTLVLPRSKSKYRANKEADKSKAIRDPTNVKFKLPVDVCTPAGVAKMLIKDSNKLSSKDLKQAMSSGSMIARQNKQIKEALFMKKVQQDMKEEQTNHLKWQVHLGMDPMSEHATRQIMEEREIAQHEYMVKRGAVGQEETFAAGPPKMFSRRVLCEVGQAPEGVPAFQFYTTFQWELRRRVLRLFQQAAHKVVIRRRMNRRLASLKKLADSMKNLPLAQKADKEKTCDLKVSADKVFPSSSPFFSNEDDPLANINLPELPVDTLDVTVTSHIPFFKLQVPLHYKLMGYQAVSAWEAFNSYIPMTLARPLRTGAPDKLEPNRAHFPMTEDTTAGEQHDEQDKDAETKDDSSLSFCAPENLLRPFPANPLRIFNPAPGLQTFKTPPKYLESDLEFHLCPLPRYTVPESTLCGIRTQTPHTQKKFLKCKEVIPGVMKWKNLDSITLKSLSNQAALTSDCAPRRSVNYNTEILPLTAASPLANLPDDDVAPLMDTLCEGSGVQLTPEMIRAEFLCGEVLVSISNLDAGKTTVHQRQHHIEATYRSEFNQMGKRVMTRLKQLGVTDRTSHLPEEDREKPKPVHTHPIHSHE
ncbi:cilia- and flagella-associated protein 221 isoform X1 [Astatotilapia calliptera]|uniref:cilia- and flagella-associated protein 221 isoform X1 n=1 Tax=Astatotilapia calliptera TaxID=8154 RepID=UPI000E41EB54|nr:cilia- and flagella-associated protein 221 isoform X1 [Astatotilapia calliptera]